MATSYICPIAAVTSNAEDVCLWPDGTWCYMFEQEAYTHMSDDFEIVPFGSDRHTQLTAET